MSSASSNKKDGCGKKRLTDRSLDDSCATDSSLVQSGKTRTRQSYKGLRLYGRLVLNKLKQKVTTSFEEVVTEIHKDLIESGLSECTDDKSTRRRVYDVLNVLYALGMVSKDDQTIRLVNDHPDVVPEKSELEKAKELAEEAMEQKKVQLQDLLIQMIAYKSLLHLKKNTQILDETTKIELPFIIVKTPKNTAVNYTISEDGLEQLITFEQPFEILDDIEVLKRMGLAFGLESKHSTVDQLQNCEKMVSKELQQSYCSVNNIERTILSKSQNDSQSFSTLNLPAN